MGGIPPFRFWRDLEKQKHLAILSLATYGLKGLAKAPSTCIPFSTLLFPFLTHSQDPKDFKKDFESLLKSPTMPPPPDSPKRRRFTSMEKPLAIQIKKDLHENPQSEGALIHAFSQSLPPQDALYLGNSLPLRYWDWLATRSTQRQGPCGANRGVNGIDGQLSTFLGWAEGLFQGATKTHTKTFRAWCLLGDLTTLYDLNALWILPQLTYAHRLGIVIVNNRGGRIFEALPSPSSKKKQQTENPLLTQPHQLHFEHWAKMWNCPYESWDHTEKIRCDMANIIKNANANASANTNANTMRMQCECKCECKCKCKCECKCE